MISLPLAIALGVIVGYFNEIEQFLSLSRTFVFFPFFLLGYYLKKETFENVLKRKSRYFAIGILVLIFLAVSYFPNFNYKWFFGSIPYAFVNTTGMDGGFIRLAVYAVSFAATLSFLALVPRKKYFFTKWGTSSLYVYLLHGFVIKYFRNSELVELFADTEQIIVFSLLSLLLIIFLSSPLMRKMTQPLIECSLTISKHRHYHEKQ